jgi:hypothetical protein
LDSAAGAGLAAAFAGAPAPSLDRAEQRADRDVSPSLAEISQACPAAGAGTLDVTLSVSSSTSGSSTATIAGFLNH